MGQDCTQKMVDTKFKSCFPFNGDVSILSNILVHYFLGVR